jgi:peptide/nickel transport system substrate-binding protein
MKKLIFTVLALTIILSLVIIGCGGGETTTTTPPPSSSAAPTSTAPSVTTPVDARLPGIGNLAKPEGGIEGGRLQLSLGANIANIGDPSQTAGPSDAGISFLTVEPLLLVDKNGQLQPWLAESYKIADDGSSITLYLRQGVSYTDGTPFNAEVAKFNVDAGINSLQWPNMKKFSQCVIIDDYTVRLDFVGGKWDWVAAKSLGTFWSAMMWDPTSLKANTPEWKTVNVVGTGPFIMAGYEPNLKITFDRNPNYWRGKPYLEGVDFSVITDTNVSLMAFKSGQIDMAGIQTQDAQGVIDDGFKIITSTDMVFNMCLLPSSGNPDSILTDINLRRAVESAINKQQIVDTLTYGYGVATNQGFCLEPFRDDTTIGYPFDLEAARNYLTSGGHPEGFTTTLYMVQGGPDDVPMAVKGMLEAVNITLNVEKIGYLQLVQMIGGGGTGWDGYIWMFGFPGDTVDPAGVLANGPLNAIHPAGDPTGWQVTTWISCEQPKELCDLAEQGSQEANALKRIPIYQEISRLGTDKYCQWSYLYYVPGLTSFSKRLHGGSFGQFKEFLWYTFAWVTA